MKFQRWEDGSLKLCTHRNDHDGSDPCFVCGELVTVCHILVEDHGDVPKQMWKDRLAVCAGHLHMFALDGLVNADG